MDKNTQGTIRTNTELEPRLKEVYDTYCVWKSLPSVFKYPPSDKAGLIPTSRQFAERMGIESEEVLELVEIKTQLEFCARYGVDKDTLTRWNKTIGVQDSLVQAKKWARSMSKNVLVALYNKAVRTGGYYEAKLWFQVVNDWEEKARIAGGGIGDVNFNIIVKKNGEQQQQHQSGTIGEATPSLGTSTQ